jgi:hypothetical protein
VNVSPVIVGALIVQPSCVETPVTKTRIMWPAPTFAASVTVSDVLPFENPLFD